MKKALITVAALACASLLNSCGFISYESGEETGTEITLISKTECDIDTVMNKPNYSKGREWLIENTGSEDLCIDSVIPSSDRIELVYPRGSQTVKKEYHVQWTKYEEGKAKEHKISKKTHMTLPTDTEPGEYLAIRAMLHPADAEEGPFSYSIKVYGNFAESPLVLRLTGTYQTSDSISINAK
ncbi:MAG: hypothetical protein J5524_00560 [Bacteroidaceae bacterium]|nr:hypothetical protein [Bacteroidaceae bacterium]